MGFTDIFKNRILLAVAAAWLFCQLAKGVIESIRNRKLTFGPIIRSGGMPSSHSATVSALSTGVGISNGFASPLFAVATCFSFLVMIDAVFVRGTAGKTGIALNKLLKKDHMKEVKVYQGHTWPQVITGATIGVLFGIFI
jgi:acid phosphatase family membrane protein YuiD